MLDQNLYPMIFKRKSFHLFRGLGNGHISFEELDHIISAYDSFVPLCPDISTAIRIVPAAHSACKRGQEYCIYLYSEKKENYLANIGYLGQQLDLFLVSQNIGSLWFGIGKPAEHQYKGLDFIIMFAIHKVNDDRKFRKDMFKSKRKSVMEIWKGEPILKVTDIVRFAPSACNSQPWIVENHGTSLSVYRFRMNNKRGMMPVAKVAYYNQIDIGIFLCFLELCLENEKISYQRSLFPDFGDDREMTLLASYTLTGGNEI